jgi:UDP-glucose 4-epimerase
MRIFFIGASSFTGRAFVERLAVNNEVFTPYSKAEHEYSGLIHQRISSLDNLTKCAFSSPFGSKNFFNFLEQTNPDVICFHHAITLDYNNSKFDIKEALNISLNNLHMIENYINKNNLKRVIITRSVVESKFNNSIYNDYIKYGKYKTLFASTVSKVFSTFTDISNFVIANPIGKYNNFKIIESFAQSYFNHKDFFLRDPFSIRDNIPIDLLAREYSLFLNEKKGEILIPKFNPMQNIELLKKIENLLLNKFYSKSKLEVDLNSKKSIFFGKDQINYSTSEVEIFWDKFIDYLQITYSSK